MDRELIPLIVAFFLASAFAAWGMFDESQNSKGSIVGFAIAIFIVAFSITSTIVFIPFVGILKMLAFGMFPAGIFVGMVYFAEWLKGKRGDPKGSALVTFVGMMFLWLVAIGIVGGGSRGYDENACHDVGTLGLHTICE